MSSICDSARYLSPDSVAFMKKEIADAGGNEVLFLGNTDDGGEVFDIRVLARGNTFSAPGIIREVRNGDVLIHNHPSGNLYPSDNDIQIASLVGNLGVGFYIISNNADAVYVVVPPYREKRTVPLDREKVVSYLSSGSAIARALDGYEERPEQIEMASKVAEAFNDEMVTVIEAGTGIGKSMAYLIPSILWAVGNGERVVVATNTINLQEQLIHKDIPFLKAHVGVDFKAVLVKGRGNYVCRRRAALLAAEGGGLFEDGNRAEEKALLDWIMQTEDGSRSDLNFTPRGSTWEKISSEADLCMRADCSYYNDCFFYRARRKAASSNILVVNHHLLFADLAVRSEKGGIADGGVLPPYQRIVIDEAHNIESVATEYFGEAVSGRGVQLLLGRFAGGRNREKGLLPWLRRKVHGNKDRLPETFVRTVSSAIEDDLLPLLERIRNVSSEFFDFIGYFSIDRVNERQRENGKRGARMRITREILAADGWKECQAAAEHFLEEGRSFVKILSAVTDRIEDLTSEKEREKFQPRLLELKAYGERFSRLLCTVASFFFSDMTEVVKWVDIDDRGNRISVRLKMSPLSVAEEMRKKVYGAFKTVILTSATLSVGGSFDFIRERLGLAGRGVKVEEILLESPFDFERQAFIGIPVDMPQPSEQGYLQGLSSVIAAALAISGGRAFVLCTSHSLMDRLYDAVKDNPLLSPCRMMRQGDEPRHTLLERFKREDRSVLFGSDSFWEGVDVAGDALSNVILTKLPFSVPDDPVIEARAEMIEKGGGNPFMDYILPLAVLKFKQGFGRLIRSRSDRGAVLILDSRVVNRSYGRMFLKSLPKCRITRGPKETVLNEMKSFFPAGSPLSAESNRSSLRS